MTEVLEFPTREVQAFTFLERELRGMLAARGADEATIKFAIEALTSAYSDVQDNTDFSFSVDLPSPLTHDQAARLQQQISEGVDALRAHHHSLVLKLTAQLLLTQLKLYQHERGDGPA